MEKFSVTKARYEDGEIIESTYVYRGVEFYRDDRVSAGYWGRYTIKISKKSPFMNVVSSQQEVKNVINRYLDWVAEHNEG